MTKTIRLAALAFAAAIAVSAGPAVNADNHGQETAQEIVGEKYKRHLRTLSNKQLRQMIVNLKSRLSNRDLPSLRAQLRAVREERSRRKAAGNTPSDDNARSDGEKQARRLLRGSEPSQSLRSPALITRIKAIRVLLKTKGLRDRTRDRLKELMLQDRAEWQNREAAKKPTEQERNARRLLKGAPSNGLKTDALRQRIQSSHDLVNGEGLQDRTREKLFNLYKADRAEYEQRKAAANQVTDAERNARKVLKSGPASTLNASQLRERISVSRNLLSTGDLTATTSSRLKKLVKADKVALNRHQNSRKVTEAERNARQFLDNARPSRELRTPALRERLRQSKEFLQFKDLKRRTRRDLKELAQSDRNALENLNYEIEVTSAERQARKLLADNETPNRLDGRVLRQRIRQTRTLLQEQDITRKTRRKLQARLERDQTELRTRDTGNNQQSQQSHADDLARQLLDDTRSAQNLPERRLKNRLRETRDLLQDRQLSRRYSRRLRDRLRDDRLELRRRVEVRRNDDSGIDLVVVEPRGDAGSLLSDRRQPHALRTKQLSHRIKRARNLLNRGGLNSYEQSELNSMLRADRRELRNRLQSRRDRRRSELTRQRRNNEINVVIAPQFDYAPRDDVAAAEADDDVIERQLVAPPTRQIDRRYTMDEFRRRPELRNYMPAVELDSIRFGFNEHFLREEEIDALERLGAIIERVVATNPNEVFLIEGHTDAVGSYDYNRGLSVKRSDAVRSALLEFFVIDSTNLSTIGYGEQFLKIPTEEEESENRRVTVRRITPLLASR